MRNSGIPALALAAVLCLAGLLASFSHGLTAKSDTFWFYLIGYQLFDGGRADTVLDGVLGAIAEQPQEPDLKFEVEFRKNSAGNYPLIAVLSYGTTRLAHAFFRQSFMAQTSAEEYVEALSYVVITSYGAAFILAMLLVIGGIALLRDAVVSAALALTVATIALLNLLPAPDPSSNLMYFEGVYVIANILVHAFNPGEALSALSFWPRNNVGLIMILVAALRWRGRYGAAYGIVAACFLIHGAQAFLALVALLAVDLFLRPSVFTRRSVHFALALAAVLLLLGAGLLQAYQWHQLGLMLVGLAAVAASILMLHRLERGGAGAAWLSPIRRLREWVIQRGDVSADLIMFVGGWIVTLPIILGLSSLFGAGQTYGADPVLAKVHSTLLVVLRPMVIFGLSLMAVTWLGKAMTEGPTRAVGSTVVASALMTVVILFGTAGLLWQQPIPMWKTTLAMDRLIRQPAEPGAKTPSSFDDRAAFLYYAVVKTVDTGHDWVKVLLANRPDLWQPATGRRKRHRP